MTANYENRAPATIVKDEILVAISLMEVDSIEVLQSLSDFAFSLHVTHRCVLR